MFTPEPYSSSVCWIRSLTSWLMMPRSRLRIGESCERDTTSRIADSATAWMVEVGSERLNRNSAGSRTFQTTWKVMSTMFSSPVSISPALVPRTVPEPISSVFSRVTWHDLVGDDRPGREVEAGLADAVAAALAEGELDRLLLGPHGVERT